MLRAKTIAFDTVLPMGMIWRDSFDAAASSIPKRQSSGASPASRSFTN